MLEQQLMQRDALYQCMEDGFQIITGNLRLQRALLAQYEQRAVAKGLHVWITPGVLQWSTWLESSWQDAVLAGTLPADRMLISAEQEHQVWARIIRQSSYPVMREDAAAQQACMAWQLLQQWQSKRTKQDYTGNIDTRAFNEWCNAFEAQCLDNGWLTRAELPVKLAELVDSGESIGDNKLLLVGFDQLYSAQQTLCTALLEGGYNVQWIEPEGITSQAFRVTCPDQRNEVEAFSRWARARLEQDASTKIGLVVHDLAAVRSLVGRSLDEILSPAEQQPGVVLESRPWNISLGLPLARFGIIETALNVLELAQHECSMHTVGNLLRSHYLAGAAQETGPRALLDARLREAGTPMVSLGTMRFRSNEEEATWYSPLLAKSLAALQKLADKCPARMTASQWAETFSRMLNAAGWGTDRTLTSDEYQAIESWRKLLASYSSLDQVAGKMGHAEALSLLRRLCMEKIFQPRSDAAPVQVLGVYEAIGQQFDALWVMDMHDGNWPPSPRPNPFIPLHIQRELGMPHADQAAELATALLITERLMNSAPLVMMSSPQKQGEEVLRISPLIQDLPAIDMAEVDRWPGKTWRELVEDAKDLEVLESDQAPSCETAMVSGGSGIFRSQSLCPFRAFAEYRLGASGLETMQAGLNAMQRGSLLHRVLELFWRDVHDHSSLAALTTEQRNVRLAVSIGTALDEMSQENPASMNERFTSIESTRLLELASEWLDKELERAPFTVHTLELKREVDINDVRVHLMIDRVDELPDGRRVIIDYKTGNVTPSKWFGERPEEPQLPLYSVAEGDTVAAVLYGQVRADKIGFSGVVQEEGMIPGLPGGNRQLKQVAEDWPQVLHEWQDTISRLADDFRAGRAEVDPKKPDTCTSTYCELSALCRIDERDDIA